ncbi:NUDIX hydrolase [Ureibacillus chungkukjangi]|uniref:8-oxo-dGTP diphosphatase n=1 Tax=Ureibacillus chungkukjangi TaxID=1202712 RepID=A0A318U938_9BACL|nr:NUDIX domain-containing protein [Ureibacillus chungkukjangi]PYF08549.1 8-oxo-dGTP diphosphatase [Ureibacillus chungkukjangi]
MTNTIVVALKGFILNNGRALFVQRAADDEIGAGSWECVGGQIEFGEDLETALLREIHEEVGLLVTIEQLLYATTFQTTPTRQVVIITYLCSSSNQNVVLSNEHSNYIWANKDQARFLLPQDIIRDFEKNNVFALEALK